MRCRIDGAECDFKLRHDSGQPYSVCHLTTITIVRLLKRGEIYPTHVYHCSKAERPWTDREMILEVNKFTLKGVEINES